MFCQKCGAKLEEGTKFCTSCGNPTGAGANAVETTKAPAKSNNAKLWKILAYIGPLFLIGLFVPEKDDKSVKFHVGQGMLVCILSIAVSIVDTLVIANIFRREVKVWGFGTGVYETSPLGILLMWILGLGVLAFAIIGIVNVCKDEDKELPLIGKFAFYK